MKRIHFNLGIKIVASARFIPTETRYTNIELMKIHPAFKDQPESRLGIFSRRIVEEFGFLSRALVHLPGSPLTKDETTSEHLALTALKQVEKSASNWKPDLFIHGTTTTSRYSGSQGTALAGMMDWHLPSYETRCGCATSLASMHMAWSMMAGPFRKIAICCSETMSKVINAQNRDDWFGMSDGAAAMFVEREDNNPEYRIVDSVFFTKGELSDLYTTRAPLPPSQDGIDSAGYFLNGDPLRLREEAKLGYNEMINLLLPNKQDREKINWVLPHQVNLQLLREVKSENGISGELLLNAQEVGNLGGTSILYSLCEAQDRKLFKKGDRILMMSVGGGLSIAGQVWEKCS